MEYISIAAKNIFLYQNIKIFINFVYNFVNIRISILNTVWFA